MHVSRALSDGGWGRPSRGRPRRGCDPRRRVFLRRPVSTRARELVLRRGRRGECRDRDVSRISRGGPCGPSRGVRASCASEAHVVLCGSIAKRWWRQLQNNEQRRCQGTSAGGFGCGQQLHEPCVSAAAGDALFLAGNTRIGGFRCIMWSRCSACFSGCACARRVAPRQAAAARPRRRRPRDRRAPRPSRASGPGP